MNKQLIHRFVYAAIALLAFIATSALIHTLLPPPIPADIAAKLEFFAQHKDEFDTLVVGTSRVYSSVSPEIFDKTTSANGLPTRTFNFGINGMHPPENFYVLEQILKTKPRNLKWVLLEMDAVQTRWHKIVGTQRAVHWHDWSRTALTLQKALDPRGEARWFVKLSRLWLARRDLASNLMLFGKRFGNVGRAAEFNPFQERAPLVDATVELGPNHDGYRVPGSAMPADRAAIFEQTLAQEVSTARPKFIDPSTENAYRNSAAQIRRAGAAPLFVVTPIIFQSAFRFRQTPAPAPLLSFNDSQKYPALYDTKIRIDDGHLTPEGAEEFTRLLAQEFVRRARQP